MGPFKAILVFSPTDCGLMVPESWAVSDEPELREVTPVQLQSSAMHESAVSGKAWHFRRSLDFRRIQHPDRNTEQPKSIDRAPQISTRQPGCPLNENSKIASSTASR